MGYTPRVQYQVVHCTDSKSLDDEGSFFDTTAIIVPQIPTLTPVVVVVVISPPPPTAAAPTLSTPPALEECLAHLEEGQVRIEGLL